jgi:RHS repeat-associated protein
VYLDQVPVSVVTGGQVYYIETDQLGTPRQVVATTNNGLRWSWDYFGTTFGETLPNENPSGVGNFTFNLRFPGQYYDVETATHYNYFRDYEPQTGRYIESDPIGILGGLGTYAYVANNPLLYLDPTGENMHGNWCGPGGGGPVRDGVDQCCKNHDNCYDKCKADWKNRVFGTGGAVMQSEIDSCDKSMCACLARVHPKNDAERIGKERVSWFFKCAASTIR